MKKRIITIMLAIAVLLSLSAFSVFAATEVPAFDPVEAAGHHDFQPLAGKTMGFRFNASAEFTGIKVNTATGNDATKTAKMTAKLYQWSKDYDTTVAGTVLHTQLLENFDDNAQLEITFSAKAAGEYMVVFSDAVKNPGIWAYTENVLNVASYTNGVKLSKLSFEVTVLFTSEQTVYFNPLSTSETSVIEVKSTEVTDTAAPLHELQTLAFRFNSSVPFTGINANCPTWPKDGEPDPKESGLTITLYKWAGSYDASVAGTKLATKTISNIDQTAWSSLKFDQMAAGEYLVELTNPVKTVGIWKNTKTVTPNIVCYEGKNEVAATFQFSLLAVGDDLTVANVFKALSSGGQQNVPTGNNNVVAFMAIAVVLLAGLAKSRKKAEA